MEQLEKEVKTLSSENDLYHLEVKTLSKDNKEINATLEQQSKKIVHLEQLKIELKEKIDKREDKI
jgi:hypothetical protein